MAPIRASKFPSKTPGEAMLLLDTQDKLEDVNEHSFARLTINPPRMATARPTMVIRLDFSFNISGEKSATQIGVVVTSTTELETLVYSSEVIQAAKCTANSNPAPVILIQSALVMDLSSFACLRRTQGVIKMEANPSLNAAITRDGISRWA